MENRWDFTVQPDLVPRYGRALWVQLSSQCEVAASTIWDVYPDHSLRTHHFVKCSRVVC